MFLILFPWYNKSYRKIGIGMFAEQILTCDEPEGESRN